MENRAIDRPALLARCLQNRQLAADLLKLFVEDVPGQIEALGEAVEARNGPAACVLTHRLKGTTATISAMDLHDAIARLDQQLRRSDWPGADDTIRTVVATAAAAVGEASSPDSRASAGSAEAGPR